MKHSFFLFILCFAVAGLYAQNAGSVPTRGNTPAEKYFLMIQRLVDENKRNEARAALDKAMDFASELSDIPYLRALMDSQENKSRYAVLDSVVQALNVSRWIYYTEEQARFMAARQLIALRQYPAALEQLSGIRESADRAVLTLTALKGMLLASGSGADIDQRRAEFRRSILDAMEKYPGDPRPLRIFFEYSGSVFPGGAGNLPGEGRTPGDEDYYLMELVLRQLPLVVEADPELAWMAAPFIRDREEARRLLASYRAGSITPQAADNFHPAPESIAQALQFSLISPAQAVDELFANNGAALDRDIITRVSDQLSSEDDKNLFLGRLLAFSGTICADDDADGIPESRAVYNDGALREFFYDSDQDGITDTYISFINGVPQWARQSLTPPGNVSGTESTDSGSHNSAKVLINWEKYPYVARAETDGMVIIPRPMEFSYTPVDFVELSGSGTYSGLLFPQTDAAGMILDRRTLIFHALQIQRPGKLGTEWIDLEFGVPWRATEIRNGQVASITEFENGQPVTQWIDLDNDSRLETVRRFRKTDRIGVDPLDYTEIIEFSQSDWNNDGLFEYAEEYLSDGSVVYYWDMDGSGVRSYSETRTGDTNHESQQK